MARSARLPFVPFPGEPTAAATSRVPPRRRSLIMASNDGEGGEEGWEAAVRAEVGGASWWDDPDGADLHARFKAFTGQRRDWPEPKLLFWKDLLLRVARRLRLCSAPAHLEEMRADGEILLKSELIVPTAGGLYQLVRREASIDYKEVEMSMVELADSFRMATSWDKQIFMKHCLMARRMTLGWKRR
ncbi:hypothetical protein TRIUR3_34421 [Triticum urartu]|uniref:Uncharacterized protein n=1 Tax=Triticum urartu TaxID=4572 RepID=M8A6I1_TRIUA|nr:hypothetical protein TRIUR3_34421 [Triticum urartu]